MDKIFSCRDIGVDCDYTVCGRTVEEVLEKVADHAQSFHQRKGFSKKDFDKARAAIHDGDCEPESCSIEGCCC